MKQNKNLKPSWYSQVLAVRGVSPVRDRDLITTAGRELAEACDMTPEEMDEAAHQIIRSRHTRDTQLPYFDHLSGYELKDYTQRSLQQRRDFQSLSREPTLTSSGSDDPDTDQEMVYVTTL